MPSPSEIVSSVPRFFDFSGENVPWLVNVISVLSMARGFRCLITPGSQYYEYGVPREGSSSATSRTEGAISPMMFVRGIREFGFGLLAATLDKNEQTLRALALVSGVMCFADAAVVLVYARTNRQMVAYHLLAATYFLAMYNARLCVFLRGQTE